MTGRYCGEFEVGETIEHGKRRTVSEADNQTFCDVTMNQQPLHLDADFAADTEFGERIVNGLYIGLAVGLTIPETTDGTIVANRSCDDVEHPEPVFHGDTVRVQSIMTDRRETSGGDRDVVTTHVEVFRVNDREGADGPSSDGTDGAEEPLACSFDRTVVSLKRPGDH